MAKEDSISVVIPAYRMPAKEIFNCIKYNKEAMKDNDVTLIIVSDRGFTFKEPWVESIVYPKELKIFSSSKVSNYGIKRAVTGIIVKSDLDIRFSSSIFKRIKKVVKYNNGMLGICSHVKNQEDIKSVDWKTVDKYDWGTGACFALTGKDWFELRGYDERLEGWGDEDNEMVKRVKSRFNLEIDRTEPLFHLMHKERKGTKQFPNRRGKNLGIYTASEWLGDIWGEAGITKKRKPKGSLVIPENIEKKISEPKASEGVTIDYDQKVENMLKPILVVFNCLQGDEALNILKNELKKAMIIVDSKRPNNLLTSDISAIVNSSRGLSKLSSYSLRVKEREKLKGK